MREVPKRLVLAACLAAAAVAVMGPSPSVAEEDGPVWPEEAERAGMRPLSMDAVLARIMQAESAGQRFAKNPRSSALGPFQFVRATFVDIARRHFAEDVDGLSLADVLHLRTDPDYAKRAARAYAEENAEVLASHGLDVTALSLHLAHFAGASGAVRVLSAEPETPVSQLFSHAALRANPFLYGMTAHDLLASLAKWGNGKDRVSFGKRDSACPGKPSLAVRCHRGRASCRRWIALNQRILDRRWRARLARHPDLCKEAVAGND